MSPLDLVQEQSALFGAIADHTAFLHKFDMIFPCPKDRRLMDYLEAKEMNFTFSIGRKENCLLQLCFLSEPF